MNRNLIRLKLAVAFTFESRAKQRMDDACRNVVYFVVAYSRLSSIVKQRHKYSREGHTKTDTETDRKIN